METFYVLRYYPGTDVKDAKHSLTTGRYATWIEAEEARAAKPTPWADQLEVRERAIDADGVTREAA